MPVSSEPFQRVSTDIFGPFVPAKPSGNRYVLVFIDYLTKYMELVPIPNVRSDTAVTAFIYRTCHNYAATGSHLYYTVTEVVSSFRT